ncbi:PREDICTED: venom protease-like [Nicrophorus vespilloides]|uniref:CLIP domain-containing serine protease n=1 Tax=Nicrophorus vespilloides TaxID=110193 RepID=A0ABM1M9Q1_NICVS|nr:PREDICTED: venom protease-like [Nicrophorus vespilloides]
MDATAVFINVLFLVANLIEIANGQTQRSCTLSNGLSGICVPIRDCPSAVALLKQRRQANICSYINDEPVVCCEKQLAIGEKSKNFCSNLIKIIKETIKILVVGGTDSLAAEFPHMAVLGFRNNDNIIWACGGALISEKFVMTAGHCLYHSEFGDVRAVRLGDLNLYSETDDAKPQNFLVKSTHRHPRYMPPSRYNDIALVELDRAATRTKYVLPACLNTQMFIHSSNAFTATGWGSLEFSGRQADHLQKVNISLVDNGRCNQFYSLSRKLRAGIRDDSQICASSPHRDTCEGDSGGPLQRKFPFGNNDFVYVIYGVTSFGKACGLSSTPGIYTRVSYFLDWIEPIVWPN